MAEPHPIITPQPGVLSIAVYQTGESGQGGANAPVKLSANENPYGPSLRAVEAAREAAGSLAVYPDGAATRLREAIAAAHGLDAARIVCGAGSDELISLLCQAYAGPGDEVLHSAHGFLMYAISTRAAGAAPVAAPETALRADVDALLAACSERTRLIFLANPNNPTGSLLSAAEVARLAAEKPARALLVLDGAYGEYLRPEQDDGALRLAAERDDVVATRTFSKIHGLAALRLGWAFGPAHVIDVLNRVRGPFNVSAPAIAAGVAAIEDGEHAARSALLNEVWRDFLAKRLAALGVECAESHGNFILARFGEDAETGVAAADAHLRRRGLIARRVDGYGLPGWLRITVGDEEACRRVVEAAAEFRAGAA